MSLLPTLDSYHGLNNLTGDDVAGDDWLRQAIRDVLTTPIGSRVMRRTYGSNLFSRIDAPMTPGLVADIVADTAIALATWLPLVLIKKVSVVVSSAGQFDLDLVYVLNGKLLTLTGALSQ